MPVASVEGAPALGSDRVIDLPCGMEVLIVGENGRDQDAPVATECQRLGAGIAVPLVHSGTVKSSLSLLSVSPGKELLKPLETNPFGLLLAVAPVV